MRSKTYNRKKLWEVFRVLLKEVILNKNNFNKISDVKITIETKDEFDQVDIYEFGDSPLGLKL